MYQVLNFQLLAVDACYFYLLKEVLHVQLGFDISSIECLSHGTYVMPFFALSLYMVMKFFVYTHGELTLYMSICLFPQKTNLLLTYYIRFIVYCQTQSMLPQMPHRDLEGILHSSVRYITSLSDEQCPSFFNCWCCVLTFLVICCKLSFVFCAQGCCNSIKCIGELQK